MINKEKFMEFCKLMRKYNEYFSKYVDAEISLELDEIAGGIIPQLLKEVFNAWFLEFKEIDYVERVNGEEYHHYGYEIFTLFWYNNDDEEQVYGYLNEVLEGEEVEGYELIGIKCKD